MSNPFGSCEELGAQRFRAKKDLERVKCALGQLRGVINGSSLLNAVIENMERFVAPYYEGRYSMAVELEEIAWLD